MELLRPPGLWAIGRATGGEPWLRPYRLLADGIPSRLLRYLMAVTPASRDRHDVTMTFRSRR